VLQGKVRSRNQKGNREASVERQASHVLTHSKCYRNRLLTKKLVLSKKWDID